MKKYIYMSLLALIALTGCTSESDESSKVGSIYGIVTEEGLAAEPLRGVEVGLYTTANSLLLKTVTYDDGHYEFTDLKAGNYQLRILAQGYEDVEYSVLVEGGRQARADMVLSAKSNIEGTVTEADDASMPVPGATIELYSDFPKTLLSKTQTATDGSFAFSGVSRGTYSLEVKADGFKETTYTAVVEASQQLRVNIAMEASETYLTVTTEVPEDVVGLGATLQGSFVNHATGSVSEAGFYYSATRKPAADGQKVVAVIDHWEDVFSATLSGLSVGTYYVQAYAVNRWGTARGNVVELVVTGNPVVVTGAPTSVTATTAVLNGTIAFEGSPAFTERGFVYSSLFPMPSLDDPASATSRVAVGGTGADYSANVVLPTSETTYSVRAYVKSSTGVWYGDVVTFLATAPKDYVVIGNLAVQKRDLGKMDWLSAVDMCKASIVGGFTDWRLPTIGELALLYEHKDEIGGFAQSRYWSISLSNYGDSYRYVYSFDNGNTSSSYYTVSWYVRAVRTIP